MKLDVNRVLFFKRKNARIFLKEANKKLFCARK